MKRPLVPATVLLVLAIGTLIGEIVALSTAIELWDAWPFAALAQASAACSLGAWALSFRAWRGAAASAPAARGLSIAAAAAVLFWLTVWLSTFFAPVQDLLGAIERASVVLLWM